MSTDIAELYIPVIPDMTHFREELEKISYEIRVAVRDGIILGVKDALTTLNDQTVRNV